MIGLNNIGATCFLNVCLQALLHTPAFCKLIQQSFPSCMPAAAGGTIKKTLAKQLVACFLDICKVPEGETISPTRFYQVFRNLAAEAGNDLKFSGQQDAMECLDFLLEQFHQSLAHAVQISVTGTPNTEQDKLAVQCYEYLRNKISKEYSPFYELFYGLQVQVLTGAISQVPRYQPEMFSILHLNIPPNAANPTLMDCLHHYLTTEQLDNVHYEDKEKGESFHESTEKKMLFWNFPPIFICDLKRLDTYHGEKNKQIVSYPEELDLSAFAADYHKEYHYRLYAVINHFGNKNGGHYTIFCHNTQQGWAHINDEQVQLTSFETVIQMAVFASCLFYQRV